MPEELLNITKSVPTPFLLVEEEIVRKNINRIHDYANRHGFEVRPHIKTHKSLGIARMQLGSGAIGVDITIAYPAVGSTRTERLAKLSLKQTIRVAVDSEYLLNELGSSALKHDTCIGILVIFDAGLRRCGTADPGQIVTLAQHAKTHPGLGFDDGIQMYLGNLYGDAARDPQSFKQINQIWEPVYEALCSAGLQPETVSSGSTPSLENTHLVCHVNEIRVGTAVLNDYFVLKFDHCSLKDCAARVVATVISDVVPGRAIIDAGSKALSAKQLLRHENLEMGFIVEYPDARITRLHEEHGWVDVSRCSRPPRIGERLSIVPVNVSLCVNLYDHFYLITRSGSLQKERVDARGCLV